MTKRILIVDDSSIMRSHCRVLLNKAIKHWLLKPYTAEELLDVVSRYAAQPLVS